VSIGRGGDYPLLDDGTTLGGLIKAKDALNDLEGSADEQAKFRFYPWRLMETQPRNYSLAQLSHSPLYPRSKVQEIRGRYRALHARSEENQSSARPPARDAICGILLGRPRTSQEVAGVNPFWPLVPATTLAVKQSHCRRPSLFHLAKHRSRGAARKQRSNLTFPARANL